ncbi:reverse transcriptase domain-containing protein [Tanacetum coccineum]
MEEMLAKFIDKDKREYQEMEIFIKEFRTTNELLLKEQNNLLSELKIEVKELSKVMGNVLIPKNKVKGVKTREKPHVVGVENKSLSILERTTQPLAKPQHSSTPFPNRLRKEKEEAQQWKFLKNLKQLHINIPFIEALVLEEACTVMINKRCSAILLNKLPSKEKDPKSFTIPCQGGNLHINNALADLGASISLMPYTMYEKLGLREPKPTRMSLELAYSDSDFEKVIRCIESVDTTYSREQRNDVPDNIMSEHLYLASASEIDEKKPELKILASHLKYAYLNGDESFPVIISSKLSEREKKLLLEVLENHKGAMA